MGSTKHIRDVFFSLYLDRPDLTHYSPLPEKEGKGSFEIPTKWSLLTRLRKPLHFSVFPMFAYLYS